MHRSAPCRSFMALAALAPLLLALAPGAIAEAETPKIYKWVDKNGIAHYTTDPERIPKALRNVIQSTRSAAERAPAPAPPPQASSPAPRPEPTAADATPAIAEAPPATSEATTPTPETTAAMPMPAPPTAETPAMPEPSMAMPEPSMAMPEPSMAMPEPSMAMPEGEAPAEATIVAPSVPAPAASVAASKAGWFDRDAIPRVHEGLLPNGQPSPGQLAALAAEQKALDSRISGVQAEIARDENFLKGLISDPDLDADIPLFDRPKFLEVSKRLPELQAQLQELRDERAKLETR